MCNAKSNENVFSQFPFEVCNFSSQYGSDASLSYTAINLTGKTNIYPNYCDAPEAFLMRTYGEWWLKASSASPPFKRPLSEFQSQDFIELKFEEKVYPVKICIYETFTPGSVIKILACNTSENQKHSKELKWEVLWSGEPEVAPPQTRIFAPPIKNINFKTNLLRIEFHHQHLNYYSELDAVELLGARETLKPFPPLKPSSLSTLANDMKDISLQGLLLLTEFSSNLPFCNGGYFESLPGEVIQSIIKRLDLPSVCSLAQTCRFLRRHCYDPLQYMEVNLQPYWYKVFDYSLVGLESRCDQTQRFNLSWCGAHSQLSTEGFNSFLRSCCSHLTCLYLAGCKFIDASVMKTLSETCSKLQELDLQNCRQIEPIGFIFVIQLGCLRKLNLYRTLIDIHSITVVLRSCVFLEHLNLGACYSISNFDDVAIEIGKNLKSLKSLDLWRAKTLSSIGLHNISENCINLMELDVGWCMGLSSSTGCFVELICKCQQLRKLFLTAIRTICDSDLLAIADYSLFLEQLDILGTLEVNQDSVFRLLCKCKNLCFIDISFCDQIDFRTVQDWKKKFPNVTIKKSY